MKLKNLMKLKLNNSILLYFFIAFLLIFIHVRLFQYAFDDAYIHFRVARNFIETGFPYYNLNEAVKVSTSSVWTIFLTMIYGIVYLINLESLFPLIISIINAAFALLGMLIYKKIIEELLKERLSWFSCLIFCISYLAIILPSSIGLMETPLALLISGLGILALIRTKLIGFFLLGVSIYIRAELIVLMLVVVIYHVIKKPQTVRSLFTYSLLGVLPFLIYDLIFFHTIIPQSVIAKSIVYSISRQESLSNLLTSSLLNFPTYDVRITLLLGLFFLVLLFIIPLNIGMQKTKRKPVDTWIMIFFLWAILIIFGYVIAEVFIFDWYIPIYTTPVLVSLLLLIHNKEVSKNIINKSLLGILILVNITSLASTFYASIKSPNYFKLFDTNSRVKMYLYLSSILNKAYPDSTLLTSEIGGLGYSFDGQILDAAGLATPRALLFHPLMYQNNGQMKLLAQSPSIL